MMADNENIPSMPEITLQLEVSETVQAPVDSTLSIAGEAADAKATGDAISALQATLTNSLAAMFPIGSVYVSINSTAPAFYGTWVEFKMPATWGDIEDGMRSYTDGTGTGTLHFWRRTA